MHPSYFLLLNAPDEDSKVELSLPASISEWLFYRKFWSNINERHGTRFEQYEEEVIPLQLVPTVIAELRKIDFEVTEQVKLDIHFLYGWNERKEGLYCDIDKNTLTEGLLMLIGLLKRAVELESEVYCQL